MLKLFLHICNTLPGWPVSGLALDTLTDSCQANSADTSTTDWFAWGFDSHFDLLQRNYVDLQCVSDEQNYFVYKRSSEIFLY